MTYFLDTNICIYFLTGRYPSLLSKMMSHDPEDIKIPAIVKGELIHGAEKSLRCEENTEKISAFLLPFEIVPFDEPAADCYGRIKAVLEKNGTPIGPNDLIIAAAALANDAVLVTNNPAEFGRVNGLRLENWICAGFDSDSL